MRMRIDEPRRHNESIRVDLPATTTNVMTHRDDHVTFYSDVATLRWPSGAVVDDTVSDDEIGTQERDAFI